MTDRFGIVIKEKEFFKYDLKTIDDAIANLLIENNINFFIGGGCFTSQFSQEKINDIDVFFRNEENLNNALRLLEQNNEYKTSFDNNWVRNIYKKEIKIQFVKKYFFENEVEMFNSFDFTCVKFAYNGSICYYHERFFIDLASKKLVIDGNLPKPLDTLRRSYKYISRGFGICPFGMAKIAKQIQEMEVDWNNPDENTLNFYPDGSPKFQGLD